MIFARGQYMEYSASHEGNVLNWRHFTVQTSSTIVMTPFYRVYKLLIFTNLQHTDAELIFKPHDLFALILVA